MTKARIFYLHRSPAGPYDGKAALLEWHDSPWLPYQRSPRRSWR